jgi:hypothetical protein
MIACFWSLIRYIDDVFMTTNLSDEKIIIELEKAKTKDPNIGITYSVSSTVDFLDVVIANTGGQIENISISQTNCGTMHFTLFIGSSTKYLSKHYMRWFTTSYTLQFKCGRIRSRAIKI